MLVNGEELIVYFLQFCIIAKSIYVCDIIENSTIKSIWNCV